MDLFRRNLPQTILWACIIIYVVYFSFATVFRMHSFSAHYYDLGIMHQTTFNTYKALQTGDFSRFLEMTNTLGPEQIKRMGIHNDIILAFIAPLYFIHNGPETLLVLQTIVLALGAYGLFLLSREVLGKKEKLREWVALVLSLSYLVYPVMNFTNLFDFHGVTLATTFLIFMFYFWYVKKYRWSFLFAVLSMLTKEQVALTVLFFAMYAGCSTLIQYYISKKEKKLLPQLLFPAILAVISLIWFILSLEVIIPMFRGGTEHFALKYYGEFGESPGDVIINVVKNPIRLLQHVLSDPSIHYLRQLFGPLAFLPLLSPHLLAIAAPEFGINLLSESGNMRNIYFHYTAVLTPFIFISTLFGFQLIRDVLKKKVKSHLVLGGLSLLLTAGMANAVFSYGPLPFAGNQQTYMFTSTPSQKEAVYSWVKKLENDSIKVASTGKYAPFFTSRRFFYDMSQYYTYADYVVVNPDEALNGWGKERAAPGYKDLIIDPDYEKVYDEEYLEVYKRK